jgi:hypothetical protein
LADGELVEILPNLCLMRSDIQLEDSLSWEVAYFDL